MSEVWYEFVDDCTAIEPTPSPPRTKRGPVPACEQCSKPELPTTIPRFLVYVLRVAFQQTGFILLQNLWSTCMLACALPQPFFQSVRLVTLLWLEIFRALYIILLALFFCAVVHTYKLISDVFARLWKTWSEIDVLRVLRRLFPFSAAAAQVSASPSQLGCR